MDRDAIARAGRQDEALEALQFERDREAALRHQIGEVVLDAERARIDSEALARLEPSDAALIREILYAGDGDDGDDDDEWEDAFADFEEAPDGEEEILSEDEVARLLGEITLSQARQSALERFVEALADTASTTATD